ncbi:hypothetical protein LTR36_007346 [Oleoguttula mirabilis]|uniref:MYND-type domain-containing protein n=1 Tax=Oleoguttula mirabilis TaxID=1507867 RepID=A0AAV9J9Z6_9PEZI|nr:hypothetical protein LTR36_007346 [Oleoguttula mirabilis]
MASDSDSDKVCATCTEKVNIPCRSCGDIRYYSWGCEMADKPSHQLLCYTVKTPEFQRRPGENTCRVLLFPKDGDKPTFVWMKVVDDIFGLKPDMDELMEHTYSPQVIDENPLTDVKLGHRIHLCHVECFVGHYNKVNMAVMGATNGQCKAWMGPMLACCGKVEVDEEGNDYIGEMMDMDMTDYSHVAQHLIHDRMEFYEKWKVAGAKVQAVLALCDGEVEAEGCQRLETYTVSRFQINIQVGGEISPISQLVGMPLKVSKAFTAPGFNPTKSSPHS